MIKKININGNKVTILKKDFELLTEKFKSPISIVNIRESKYAVIKETIKGVQHSHMVSRLLLGLDVRNKKFVQFIDHNPLNLSRDNLKAVSVAELRQTRLKSTSKKYSSKFKGVSWHSIGKKWQATIKPGKDFKNINLGLFTKEIDAAEAYNDAAIKYHGSFAVLNKV